ncbi:hypothetical protein PFLUV_G00105130 [Perca fluviatilis]|uniref:SPRY-associated domain-containing protein n=1 Tax=Perca fluviatilis TaxID=8168 RepID=A0A6A5F1C7_PERFL|nr:hypothetical protein PFLUV_G00105130 [Perca fluviatilis]
METGPIQNQSLLNLDLDLKVNVNLNLDLILTLTLDLDLDLDLDLNVNVNLDLDLDLDLTLTLDLDLDLNLNLNLDLNVNLDLDLTLTLDLDLDLNLNLDLDLDLDMDMDLTLTLTLSLTLDLNLNPAVCQMMIAILTLKESSPLLKRGPIQNQSLLNLDLKVNVNLNLNLDLTLTLDLDLDLDLDLNVNLDLDLTLTLTLTLDLDLELDLDLDLNLDLNLLEENICTFVKNELKKIQKVLSPDYPECSESKREDEDEEQRRSREAFLKITLHFLRRMKQEELADRLQSRTVPAGEEELDEFDLKKYSASEEALLRLLPVVKASNKALLSGCNLSERSCEALSSVLSSQSSSLRELDLSNNNLQDSGGKLISDGLKGPHCTLETLSLSGCLISEEGCSSLVSALSSNPSHLRELDLSYNHPGDSGVKLLSAGRKDPLWRLDTLRVEPAGVRWLTPGLRKYSCELTLNRNTVNRKLKLSDNNRKVTRMEEDQPYPDHPERVEPAGVRRLTPGPKNYSCELTLNTNTVGRKLKLSDNNRKGGACWSQKVDTRSEELFL